MPGIMSGLEPVRLKDGGFPDLTGDGKVTRADILKGRGVEGFAEGGDADKSFFNPQRTATGSGANIRDFTDFIFDPTDPVDYALLPLLAFPPAAIAGRLMKMGLKGNKLAKSMDKVNKIKDAQRGMGKKAKDLFTTDPVKNLAAANGLLLGPTRATASGIAGQMTARNELADLLTTNERSIKRIGPAELYSYEAREEIKEDPSMVKKGGLKDLVEISEVASELYNYAKDPEEREYLVQALKDSVPDSVKNFVGTVDSEIVNRKDGGIMKLKKGGVLNLSRSFLNKVKKNKALQNKDGSPKKSTKEYKEEIKKQQEAKKAATAKQRAETRRAKQEAQAREEAERQARLSRAEAARARTGETPQQRLGSQSAQADVGPARPTAGADGPIPSQGPAIASKVDDSLNASKQASAAKKADDGIPPGPAQQPPAKSNIGRNLLYGAGALTIGANVIPALLKDSDGSDEKNPANVNPNLIPQNPSLTDRKTTLTFTGPGFNTKKETSDEPQLDQSLMYYMKQNLNEKGFDLDADTQTFTGDKKPTFFDYVKSLPGGYADKVADDEDYAKKMMAGFLNMMKPVEGYVPINPAVAFGEGYLGEETRQADMLPADAKLMEYLKKNPNALAKLQLLEASRAGTTVGETKAEDVFGIYGLLVEGLRQRRGIKEDDIANFEVIYVDPVTGESTPVDIATFTVMVDNPIDALANPNFDLKIR